MKEHHTQDNNNKGDRTMTTREAIEKFHEEALETIHGAMNQGFTGNELMGVIVEQLEKDKKKLLEEIDK